MLGQGKNGWRAGVKTTAVKGYGDHSLIRLSGSGRNGGSKSWGRFSKDLGWRMCSGWLEMERKYDRLGS